MPLTGKEGKVAASIWEQWNEALAARLTAGGFDLSGQVEVLTAAVTEARGKGDRVSLWAALNGLCKMRLAQKRVPEAKALAEEALALADDIFGRRSAESGTVLSDLIFVEALLGREDRAQELVQRLIGIIMDQASRSLDHAFSYNLSSLATFFTVQGLDEQAERLLWRVINKGEDQAGTDPDLLLFVYDNLAHLYLAKQELRKAQQAKARALRVMERAGYSAPEGERSDQSKAPHLPTLH